MQTWQAAQATVATPGETGMSESCRADVNSDGRVTVADLLLIMGAYGQRNLCDVGIGDRAAMDVTRDCAVTVADLLAALSAFGLQC